MAALVCDPVFMHRPSKLFRWKLQNTLRRKLSRSSFLVAVSTGYTFTRYFQLSSCPTWRRSTTAQAARHRLQRDGDEQRLT